MKSKVVIILPFVLIIAIIYGIFAGESWKWEAEQQEYYKAVPVAIRDVENIIHTRGKIRAKNTKLVLSEVSGVVQVFAQAGESVSKDQVLANLTSNYLLEQIEQTQILLQIDKNRYLNAKEQADRRLEEANKNYEYIKGLYRLQFASKNELDKALQECRDAKKETIVDTLDSDPTELEVKYLKYKQSELILTNLLKDLEHNTIKSPMDGIVTAIYVKDSDSISVNNKLFEIAALDEVEVHTTVGEHDANEVKLGMNVVVTGDAFENDYQGKITNISTSSIDSGNDSVVEVIIDIENELSELKHNIMAHVDILVSSIKNVVTVPVDAIGIDRNGETVVIEKWWDQDMEVFRYTPRSVLTGIQNEQYVHVTSEEVQVGINVIAIYKPELDPNGRIK